MTLIKYCKQTKTPLLRNDCWPPPGSRKLAPRNFHKLEGPPTSWRSAKRKFKYCIHFIALMPLSHMILRSFGGPANTTEALLSLPIQRHNSE